MGLTQPCSGILIVEDDLAIREALTEILEDEGYQVQGAANGQEAIQLLRERTPPCLILLDLMMPVMNGWQFRAEQKQDPVLAPVPVVVISADSDLKTKAAAIEAVDYLPKPVQLTRLLDTIEQYCGS
ncbi:MAG TPA: response regulator [Herpetosiphonaceae bacterium]